MYKKIISAITAAAICAGTLCTLPVSAKIDLDRLPVPISSDKKTVKSFQRSKPTIKLNKNRFDDYWYLSYYRTIYWDPVDGALYYEIYSKAKNSDKFTLTDTVFNTEYNVVVGSIDVQYYVRAVTFTETDFIKYSKNSNTVTVKGDKKTYDDDYEYSEEYCDDEAEYEYAAADSIAQEPSADASVSVNSNGLISVPPISWEPYNTEEYSHAEESGYKNAALSPLSTFSADVDTASYANLRRVIKEGKYVSSDMVRIEEMLNYFDYDYDKPKNGAPFSVDTELTMLC